MATRLMRINHDVARLSMLFMKNMVVLVRHIKGDDLVTRLSMPNTTSQTVHQIVTTADTPLISQKRRRSLDKT